jgi:hypothetical protein
LIIKPLAQVGIAVNILKIVQVERSQDGTDNKYIRTARSTHLGDLLLALEQGEQRPIHHVVNNDDVDNYATPFLERVGDGELVLGTALKHVEAGDLVDLGRLPILVREQAQDLLGELKGLLALNGVPPGCRAPVVQLEKGLVLLDDLLHHWPCLTHELLQV